MQARLDVRLYIVLAVATATRAQSPFAARVVSYDPAPGQFVQQGDFSDPARALGPPRGGTLLIPDNTSIVSLGALGGSITLAFDHTVEDHPLNPFGMDAIVFGNAFHPAGDEQRRWAEVGTVEISRDANGNRLADDPWYLIPGSHINVTETAFLIATWDDNTADATYPPALASWLPPGASGTWQSGNYELPLDVFGNFVVINPGTDPNIEGIYGYADYSVTLAVGDFNGDGLVDDASLTPEVFYAIPDDPLTVGISPGSGGGDAFDIAWAVDPDTGEPANLDAFDFIRITSAVAVLDGPLGEISTEVDAVSDVAPDFFGDADGDEDVDLADVVVLLSCLSESAGVSVACASFDRDGNTAVEAWEARVVLKRLTGPLEEKP